MPRKQRVVGSNPTQGSPRKKGYSGFVELFAFALLITSLMTHVTTLSQSYHIGTEENQTGL